jgi:hypothetical protein
MDEQPSREARTIKKEHRSGAEHTGYEMLSGTEGSKGVNSRGELELSCETRSLRLQC